MTGQETLKIIATLKAATWLFVSAGVTAIAMDPTVKVAIIASAPATITGIAGFIMGLVNKNKIREVHLTMNSRLDELLSATKISAYDAGRREGIESEQARMRPADPKPPSPPPKEELP